MAEKPLIVDKYGRTSLTNKRGMDRDRIDTYAERIKHLRKQYDVIA